MCAALPQRCPHPIPLLIPHLIPGPFPSPIQQRLDKRPDMRYSDLHMCAPGAGSGRLLSLRDTTMPSVHPSPLIATPGGRAPTAEPVVESVSHSSGPVLKYRGSKWRLAPWIIRQFPAHRTYIEPYFGSGAVFFTKPPSRHEIINDLSGDVINLFRMLRERGSELAALIAMTPWARAEYEASYAVCGDEDDNPLAAVYRTLDPLEAARRFLVRCWQAAHLDFSRHTIWRHQGPAAHSSTTALWAKLPGRLRWAVERLKDAEIECVPALELIARNNRPDVLLYVDPPYVLSTRQRRRLYEHEMSDADHAELLEALDRHSGAVVLSGYPHPLYERRLAQWRRIEAASIAEGGGKRIEVLWIKRCAGA